jgi:hypothetical protein
MNSKPPVRTAAEYGPIAFGAFGLATARLGIGRSGRLDDPVRAQAPSADAHAPDAAIDQRPNRLQVGLEAPGADVVGMTDLPADDRRLSADFALFGHNR